MSKFVVVRDDREREGFGWTFDPMEVSRLGTGDYSVKGLESVFTIERKQSCNELSNNLFSKDKERFALEMERLAAMPHSYIVLEFAIGDVLSYPYTSDLPPFVKKRIKIKGNVLLARILELQATYRVPILFAGKDGKKVAESLCKRVWEIELNAS